MNPQTDLLNQRKLRTSEKVIKTEVELNKNSTSIKLEPTKGKTKSEDFLPSRRTRNLEKQIEMESPQEIEANEDEEIEIV